MSPLWDSANDKNNNRLHLGNSPYPTLAVFAHSNVISFSLIKVIPSCGHAQMKVCTNSQRQPAAMPQCSGASSVAITTAPWTKEGGRGPHTGPRRKAPAPFSLLDKPVWRGPSPPPGLGDRESVISSAQPPGEMIDQLLLKPLSTPGQALSRAPSFEPELSIIAGVPVPFLSFLSGKLGVERQVRSSGEHREGGAVSRSLCRLEPGVSQKYLLHHHCLYHHLCTCVSYC